MREVTFLDSSKANIPFTEENETKLLEYMIEQAEERRDNSKIYNVKGKLKRKSIKETPIRTKQFVRKI